MIKSSTVKAAGIRRELDNKKLQQAVLSPFLLSDYNHNTKNGFGMWLKIVLY